MKPSAEVRLSGIKKAYIDPAGRRFDALKGIDLSARSGECLSLLGPSGCGKSTLLRIIAGLEAPDSGRVEIGGRDVTALPPERRPTAMVFQNYALFPHLTVEGNVAFGLKIRKLPGAEIRRKVGEALELVQLAGLNARKMSELSGGQQQRVALARALVVEPAALLMDEPLSNLDASLRRTTRSAIRRIQSDLGLTLIYVTHDQEEALLISDRIALMREGEIIQEGPPRELYEAPASAEAARFLGQRSMIAATVARVEADGALAIALGDSADGPAILVRSAGAASPWKPGDRVWLALKAEDVEIGHAGETPSPWGGWPAELRLISFAGTHVEAEAALAGTGQTLRAAVPLGAAAGLARGRQVLLRARENSGLIFSRIEHE